MAALPIQKYKYKLQFPLGLFFLQNLLCVMVINGSKFFLGGGILDTKNYQEMQMQLFSPNGVKKGIIKYTGFYTSGCWLMASKEP